MTAVTLPPSHSPTSDVAGLVRRYQDGVWRYLRLLGCSPEEADDLVQDTFLVALRKGLDDREPAAAATWLRRVARYLWLDRVRRTLRRGEVAWADAADLAWDPDDRGGSAWLEALRQCLDGLDGRSARVVELRYREKRSRAEVAHALGMRENGVKTLIQRLRRGLRECVERRLES